MGQIEINVVHYDKIQKPIAIEIDEGATRAPARLGRKQSPFFGFILERAVPQISIENILPPLRNEQVRVPMIVDVSDAYSLSPSGLPDSCFVRDVFELEAAKIVIKKMFWLSRVLFQPSRVDQKNVRESVIVVVEDCDAIAGCLHDVLF